MKYIDDEGFSRRVLERLPPRKRRVDRRIWRSLALVGVAAAACFLFRDQLTHVTASWLGLAGILLAVLGQWAPEEG